MLREDDLDAAVKAGVISAEQRKALEAQAAGRRGARAFAAGRDERFRFIKGFNDVFLTLGVLLVTGAFLTRWSPTEHSGGLALLAGAAVLWAISEILVARRKAVLPGMAAVLAIGLMVSLAAGQWAIQHGFETAISRPRAAREFPFGVWMVAVGAGWAAVALFYLRFRLPFALLPLAVGLIATIILAVVNRYGFETTRALVNATAIVMGLVTFGAALGYDVSDPERLTRRSDCAFWLHLAAAPFIVHPTISAIVTSKGAEAALATIAIVGVLGLVAVVIDRRALLVSSLTYFGLAIGYLVRHGAPGSEGLASVTATLALLGAFVIAMGLGWHTLRRLILVPFRGAGWLKFLPPVQMRAGA